MQEFKSFSKRLETLTLDQFDDFALELVQFQARHNPIYGSYLKARKIEVPSIQKLEDIPFLPIQFFKDSLVYCGNPNAASQTYSSSGTTGMITSKHLLWSQEFYLNHAQRLFEQVYGPLTDFHVLALLPAYLERPGSSLVAMASHFINQSKSEASGFYLYNQQELLQQLSTLASGSRKVLLLGVTFALLDLAESKEIFQGFPNLIVMETGGMKGRKKELTRAELHAFLKANLGVESIHAEYGMTELQSQAYSKGEGIFRPSSTMKILLRSTDDPFEVWESHENLGKTGAINVIDLANEDSISFIATDDLGRFTGDGGFEILGRIDNADMRGCSLLSL